jgi:hypothetical protein
VLSVATTSPLCSEKRGRPIVPTAGFNHCLRLIASDILAVQEVQLCLDSWFRAVQTPVAGLVSLLGGQHRSVSGVFNGVSLMQSPLRPALLTWSPGFKPWLAEPRLKICTPVGRRHGWPEPWPRAWRVSGLHLVVAA